MEKNDKKEGKQRIEIQQENNTTINKNEKSGKIKV